LSITTSLEIVRSNIATSLGEISEFIIASTSYGFGFELDWSTDILSLEFV
jgi:hypothetical protein